MPDKDQNRPVRDLENRPREPELEEEKGEVEEFDKEGEMIGEGRGTEGRQGKTGSQTDRDEFKRRKQELVKEQE